MGAAVLGVVWHGIVGLVTSYAFSAVTNKLFGKKTNSSSPTYSMGALQTQTNSDSVMPIIYGRVKCAGNDLWQSDPGNTVQRLVGFGIGKNKGVSAICLNDLLVMPGAIFTIKNTQYSDAKVSIGGNQFNLYTQGHWTNIFLVSSSSAPPYASTIQELVDQIRSYSGWVVENIITCSNKVSDLNTLNEVGCYNLSVSIIVDGLPGCSYTAYMGDGEQQIDSRVTGATQEDKAKLVGGLKYDAYLALTITASDTISGNPNATAIWDGRIVHIYDTPTTYHEDWSDNVWCILDLMTSVDGCNIPISNIDVQSFITAAAYAQPADGSRRWSFNEILDEKKSRQDWLNEMLLCFRAFRTYQDGKHGIILDKPEPVSQIFIVKPDESIQIDWQALSEDVERIILKYPDPDYERQAVGAPATMKPPFRNATYNPDGTLLSNGTPLSKTVEVNGITNFLQASQHSWFYLNQAQTCGEYITYTTNKRAINRTIGDVVGIYNPITQVTEPGLSYKRYRIMAMTEPQGISIQLYCREYNEALYTDQAGSVAPVVNVTKLPNPTQAPPDVSNIQLDQVYYRQKDGTIVSYITGACDLPDSLLFGSALVEYSEDNGQTWKYSSTITRGLFTIGNVKTGITYLVKIKSASRMSSGIYSNGALSGPITITGKDSPPSDVPSITAVIDPSDSTKITLTWPAVTDVDLNGYQLMEASAILTPTPISDTRYIFTATQTRQHTFSVRAIDNSGNPSTNPATISKNIIIEPAQVAGFSVIQKDADHSHAVMSWTANTETDISYYEIRQGATWDAGSVVATQLKATNYEYIMSAEGNYSFMIKAVNVSGHYSVAAAVVSQTIVLRPHAPVSGTITPDPQDATTLVLSWQPVTDTDLSTYEIRQGTNWSVGTLVIATKETQYRYKCSASGSYSFMIAAKNVAGYYSTPLNLTCQANIEPLMVTGFAATQTIADRTKVRLLWNQPNALDVAYYEIRQGASWNAAIVIGQRVTGTFFDYILPVNGSETFWICAVNVGGVYSKTPASITGIYNLAPDFISNLQIVQNPNDRSKLTISWTGITESDLLEYDVCLGDTWGTPFTVKETSFIYPISASGNYTFRVKSKNTGGYYSSEVFASGTFQIEPADVIGLSAMQNGKNVMLTWAKSADNDVVGYEIHQGNSYDNGSTVASGVTLANYTVPVDTNKLYQYYVKAINSSGHYSVNAASVTITVADLPPINVIASYDEIALKTGTNSNTVFGASTFTFATLGGRFSDYPTTRFSDIGGTTVLKLALNGAVYFSSGTYTCQRIDVGSIITANISAVFQPSVLLQGGVTANLQFRYSQDGTNFTAWQNFVPLQATFRYLDFQVLLATTNTAISPEVNQFTIRIDVPDKATYGNATIAVGGTTVPYGYTYYNQAHPLPMAIGAGLYAQIVSIGLSSFVCKVVNTAGTDVGGPISWTNNGY